MMPARVVPTGNHVFNLVQKVFISDNRGYKFEEFMLV